MVYVEELGYDPDEWEECAEPQHFLVFTFFTKILFTFVTISFATFFFWLLNQSKVKKQEGKKPNADLVIEFLLLLLIYFN